MGLLGCQRYFSRCNHVVKPKRPIIVRQEFEILVAVYWVWPFAGWLSVLKKLCYIALYHAINNSAHWRALWIISDWDLQLEAVELRQLQRLNYVKDASSLQPSNVSRTALILLSFNMIMCHWNVLDFALSEGNLGLTPFWRVVTM